MAKADDGDSFWGEDGFTFSDILDIINPFQQLPVVSTLYREASDDGISTASRLAGGALLGGPVGFLLALFNTIIEDVSGKDVGGHLMAAMADGKSQEANQFVSEAAPPAAARRSVEAYLKAQSLLS